MVITRSWLVVAAVVSIGVSGCKKDDASAAKPDEQANKDEPAKPADQKPAHKAAPEDLVKPTPPAVVDPSKQAESPPAQPSPQPLAIVGGSNPQANADLAILPVDSEVVAGINVAQMQQSALWKQFVTPAISASAPTLKSIKTACGFDPLTAITNVSIGVKNVTTSKPEAVFVIHGLDKTKMLGPCLGKIKIELAKEHTKVALDGEVVTITGSKPGQQIAFTFTDASTLVGALGASGTKAGVLALAQGGSQLAKSSGFVDMYSKINTSESVWALANGNSHLLDKLAAIVKPRAVYGSINFTDGIGLDLRLRLDSADQAKQLASMGKSQQAASKAYFDRLDVSSDGPDVHIGIGLSVAQIMKLRSQFGAMLGGLGGP